MNIGHGCVITSLKTQCIVIHPCPKIVRINLESLRDVIVPWDMGYALALEGPVHTCTHTVHRLAPLRWRHNRRDGVSNHLSDYCLLNRLFRRRSKKTSKLCVTGICAGNSPVTGLQFFPDDNLHKSRETCRPIQPQELGGKWLHGNIYDWLYKLLWSTENLTRTLHKVHMGGLVQDCSISSANAVVILQSCAKSSISRSKCQW